MVARWFCPVLVAGGSKSLPNALFRAAASAGATCHVSARVTHVGHAGPGFQLSCADGRQVRARNVICTLDPRTTFTGLLDPALVPSRLAAAGRSWAFDDLALLHRALRHRRDAPGFPARRRALPAAGGLRQRPGSRRSPDRGARRAPAGAARRRAERHHRSRPAPGIAGPLRAAAHLALRHLRATEPPGRLVGQQPAGLPRGVLALPLRRIPGAARGAADRAVRRRARRSQAAVRHHQRRHRAARCSAAVADAGSQAAPAVRRHTDAGAGLLPRRWRRAPGSPWPPQRGHAGRPGDPG